MSLNTNSVAQQTAMDPFPVAMDIDSNGQKNPLPMDVARVIFQNLKADLPSVALVCRNWKAIADDELFRKMIRPAQAFGVQEWKEYIGVDAGKEPLLPRRIYGDMERGKLEIGNYYLTVIPEKVKMAQVNGKIEDASLDSLEFIGKLVANPIKGNKIGYDPDSLQTPIREKRNPQKLHWVLISKEIIGKERTYEVQQRLAKEENNNIRCANISGLIDTVVSVFMEYVRSGERNYICDFDSEFNWVRVNEQAGRARICLCFAPSGLLVCSSNFNDDLDDLGVALAWKSFEY